MPRLLQVPKSWEKTADQKILESLKIDSFQSWADKLPQRTRRNREQTSKDNVIRVLSYPEIGPNGKLEMIKEFDYTHNLATNDGEIYYAKKGAGEAPAGNENFLTGRFEMGTTAYVEAETDTFNEFDVAGTSKITGSRVTYTATYPKTNDTGDADNTGDAIDAVSYAINYTAASWSDTDVEQGCIHDNASPVGATKLLAVFSFTSFGKTTSDTLKIFVNHAMENQ